MTKVSIVLAACLLASVAAMSPGSAAEGPTTIKVALIDMSAAVGTMGRGMMGGPMMRGWWGQGQS